MELDRQGRAELDKAAALDHFAQVDGKLYALAVRHLAGVSLPRSLPAKARLAVLMKSIVGQQISVKAANSIWQRLQPQLFASDGQPRRPTLQRLTDNGASGAKAKSLLNLNRAQVGGQLDMVGLDGWSDQQVVDYLVQFPGVGPWTAEMFLINALGRPDVFSLRDLGLRVALSRLHRLPAEIPQLEPLARSYSPHGTLAALVCWHSLNNGDLYESDR